MVNSRPIAVTFDEFLAANANRLKHKAVENYHAAVKRWTAFAGPRPIEIATRRKVVDFADGLDDVSPTTKARMIRNLARVFDHAVRHRDELPQNPFRNVVSVSQDGVDSFLPFSDDDIVGIYSKASPDLQRAFLFALYSGMRRSEILRAERAYIQNIECWKLTEGKSRNAARLIPIHPRLRDIAPPTKSDNALTVELGRIRKRAGIEGRGALHRARKSFTTKLEQAGVPEGFAARLLGHRMATLSYGLYSGGQDVAVLADAVRKVSYPALEELL